LHPGKAAQVSCTRQAIDAKLWRAWGQGKNGICGMKLSLTSAPPSRRKQELTVFVVLTLLLAPVLAVATVGGYGLGIWIYQMISGPPGPPPKAPRLPGIVPQ
jgi:nitrate reductase NapE